MNTTKYLLLAAALLMLASCSGDGPTEDQALPEGKYPMEFSLSFAPQSRVTANDDGMGCKWDDGDEIIITVTQNGHEQTATATIDADGNITGCNPALYWTSTSEAKVTAKYTKLDNYTDQRESLAYVLMASTTASYGSNVELAMVHKLAQVRLRISGYLADDFGDAQFYGYHTYEITDNGVSTTAGTGRGYITMHKDEKLGAYVANVAPGDITISDGSMPFKFSNGKQTEVVVRNQIEAGQVHTFYLTSERPAAQINGHDAVMMRRSSGTPGSADFVPALYFATCNIGAATPYDAGLFFWWGDTQGHTGDSGFIFDINNSDIKEYDTAKEYFDNGMLSSDDINEGVLTPGYDAATQHFGKPWRMMTKEESQWLCDNTTQELNNYHAKSYVKFTSKDTGNSIVVPLAGYGYGSQLSAYNATAKLWTSQSGIKTETVDGQTKNWYEAYALDTDNYNFGSTSYELLGPSLRSRCLGLSIRPVANL